MAKVAIGLEVSPNGVRAARVRGDKGSVTLGCWLRSLWCPESSFPAVSPTRRRSLTP